MLYLLFVYTSKNLNRGDDNMAKSDTNMVKCENIFKNSDVNIRKKEFNNKFAELINLLEKIKNTV